jgi:hypothetical protein
VHVVDSIRTDVTRRRVSVPAPPLALVPAAPRFAVAPAPEPVPVDPLADPVVPVDVDPDPLLLPMLADPPADAAIVPVISTW